MSKDTTTTKATTEQQKVYQPGAEFVAVDLDMPSWKPELFAHRREGTAIEDYKGQPLVGKLIECRNFGDAVDPNTGAPITDENGEVRQLRGIVVELEQPLKVQGRDKSQPAFEAKIGDKVLVFPTVKFAQAILAVARPPAHLANLGLFEKLEMVVNHPDIMMRVYVMPLTRTPHPKSPDKRIWNYEFRVDPKPYKRTGILAASTQFWSHALPPTQPNAAAGFAGAGQETVLQGNAPARA